MAKRSPEEVALDLLEGAGLVRQQVIGKLEELKAQHGWAEVPLQYVLAIVSQYLDAEKLKLIVMTEAYPAILELVKTGKGKISKSPVDLG